MMIDEKIHVKEIYKKLNPYIFNYIYKLGKIVGYKKINHNQYATIIELNDFRRIWMLTCEIQFI